MVLLHGWPGLPADYDAVLAGLPDVRVIVPDLRGMGAAFDGVVPVEASTAQSHADRMLASLDDAGIGGGVVIAGYDIGSRVAQLIAKTRPDRVRALVIAPPLPGIGRRILEPDAQREFWYQPFHQLELASALVDGRPDQVRSYLEHFWRHWSGPDFEPDAARLDHLTEAYAPAGAFTASIGWYRAGAGAIASSLAEQAPGSADRIATPTTVLWPEHDPLFPRAWSDRIDEFFAGATLIPVDGIGHFGPVEAPSVWADAVLRAADR